MTLDWEAFEETLRTAEEEALDAEYYAPPPPPRCALDGALLSVVSYVQANYWYGPEERVFLVCPICGVEDEL